MVLEDGALELQSIALTPPLAAGYAGTRLDPALEA